MKITELNNQLERLIDTNTEQNFVSLGLAIYDLPNGNKEGIHSAIFICLNGDLNIFHFLPEGIEFLKKEDIVGIDYYYHKKLEFMPKTIPGIEAFIAHCLTIQKQSNLKFGFIFDGSYYDSITHKHFSKSGLPELSTCVGFCINVLSGWIYEKDLYIEVSDWKNINIEHPSFSPYYEKNLIEFPEIDKNNYKAHHRRITPNECTASAYYTFNDITITKSKIDNILTKFNEVVKNKEIPLVPNKAS